MLNGAARKRAIADLKSTHERYVDHVGLLTEAARRLAEVREHTAEKVIARCEQYVNTLANSPKSFDRTINEFKAKFIAFEDVMEEARREAEGVNLKAGTGAAAGVGAGVATLAFGPSAAMAFATTFGTASTGTAISSLSGAAATNAALAWLGGGVAAGGGGGMAGGAVLLAMANPVGLAIGAASIAGTGLYMRGKNRRIIEKCNAQRREFEKQNSKIMVGLEKTRRLADATQELSQNVVVKLNELQGNAPSNYAEFDQAQKETLTAVINHVQSLCTMLGERVHLEDECVETGA